MRYLSLLTVFAILTWAGPAFAQETVLITFTVQSNIGGRAVTLSPAITTKNKKQATLQVSSDEGKEPLLCKVKARPTVDDAGQVRIEMSLSLSSGEHRFEKALDFVVPQGKAKQFHFDGSAPGEQVDLSVQASVR